MMNFIKKHPLDILLAFFIGVYVIIFSYTSIHRYLSFDSYYYDLGIMNQVASNTARGHFLEMTNPDFGVNLSRFAIHFDPIIAFFSPFYLLWDGPEVLLIGQSIILGLGAWAVYLLARSITKRNSVAFVFALSYLLYPPVHWQNMFDFHGVSLATTFLLFMLYFGQVKKYRLLWVFAILALLTKEHVGLVVAMYGLYMAVLQRERKIGAWLAVIGFFTFAVTVFYIVPVSRMQSSFFLRYFEGESGSIGALFDPARANFLGRLVMPYLPFILFSPLQLIIALPEIAINFVSSNSNMRSFYHYNALTVPFVLYSAIWGYHKARTLLSKRRAWFTALILIFLVLTVRSTHIYGTLPYLSGKPFYHSGTLSAQKLSSVRKWQEKLKDSDLKVASTPQLAPFFTSRTTFYNFLYDTEFAKAGLSEADIIRGIARYEAADYVIIAQNEVKGGLPAQFYAHLLSNPRFRVIEVKDGIEVFEKRQAPVSLKHI
jgi:uncharacterized membrane protein